MEMLIFFFLSLIAGVLAAYYTERFSVVSKDPVPLESNNEDTDSVIQRLRKISRQI